MEIGGPGSRTCQWNGGIPIPHGEDTGLSVALYLEVERPGVGHGCQAWGHRCKERFGEKSSVGDILS
jgi:hypothetical protein